MSSTEFYSGNVDSHRIKFDKLLPVVHIVVARVL